MRAQFVVLTHSGEGPVRCACPLSDVHLFVGTCVRSLLQQKLHNFVASGQESISLFVMESLCVRPSAEKAWEQNTLPFLGRKDCLWGILLFGKWVSLGPFSTRRSGDEGPRFTWVTLRPSTSQLRLSVTAPQACLCKCKRNFLHVSPILEESNGPTRKC